MLLGVLKALRLREPIAGAKVDSFNAPTTSISEDGILTPPMVALTDMSPDIAGAVRFMIRHRKPDVFFQCQVCIAIWQIGLVHCRWPP